MRVTKKMLEQEVAAFAAPLEAAMKRLWLDGITPQPLAEGGCDVWRNAFGQVQIADIMAVWEQAQRNRSAIRKHA